MTSFALRILALIGAFAVCMGAGTSIGVVGVAAAEPEHEPRPEPEPSNQSTGLRIAVVDPNRIVEESPQYESARELLLEELNEREAALLEQQEGIDRLQKRLERDAALMSEDELQRLRNDIRSRTRRLRYEKEEMQEDFALRKNELRTRLVKQVEEVVAQIAREKDIDLILTDGVVYFSERMDVSEAIIKRLKQEFSDR